MYAGNFMPDNSRRTLYAGQCKSNFEGRTMYAGQYTPDNVRHTIHDAQYMPNIVCYVYNFKGNNTSVNPVCDEYNGITETRV